MKRPGGAGIQSRIALLCFALVVLTALAVCAWVFQAFDSELLHRKSLETQAETHFQALRFEARVEELGQDALFLAGTPPISGIMRARTGGGIDPLDGSTEELWRSRLETIFTKLALSKPHYFQVRYVDAQGPGMEIVRVDRFGPDGALRVTPREELSPKAHRDYFQEALRKGPGEVTVSRIELNREGGEIALPATPVLRASVPVYHEDKLVGLVIINQSIEHVFEELALAAGKEHLYFLTNSEGDYLLHPDPSQAFRFEYGEERRLQDDYPQLGGLLESPHEIVDTRVLGGSLVTLRTVAYDPSDPKQRLGLLLVEPLESVLAASRTVRKQSYLIVAGMILLGMVSGYLLARYISTPFVRMAESVRAHDKGPLDLPTQADGEAGELARAFSGMLMKLNEQQEELRSEIRERERAEERLKKVNDSLARSNTELEQFAYVASHDLQAPLRAVLSFSQLLELEHQEELKPEAREYVSFILEGARRMRRLISDLLEFSKVDSETRDYSLVELQSVMAEVLENLRVLIEETDAKIECQELPQVYGYRCLLLQLFQNLLQNSLKYRSPERRPEVKITVESDPEGWIFHFADNGVGIAAEYQERVFQMFQRLDPEKNPEGTGVGLPICKKISEYHEGRLEVQSEPGTGTVFSLFLPKR